MNETFSLPLTTWEYPFYTLADGSSLTCTVIARLLLKPKVRLGEGL